MQPHVIPITLGLPCHRIRGQLDVQDGRIVDRLAMEAEGARTRQPPAQAACSQHVGVGLGQRVPRLTHSDQSTVRDQDANRLVVEPHASKIGSARDSAEVRCLTLESHRPSLAVHPPCPSRRTRFRGVRRGCAPVQDDSAVDAECPFPPWMSGSCSEPRRELPAPSHTDPEKMSSRSRRLPKTRTHRQRLLKTRTGMNATARTGITAKDEVQASKPLGGRSPSTRRDATRRGAARRDAMSLFSGVSGTRGSCVRRTVPASKDHVDGSGGRTIVSVPEGLESQARR